MKGMNTLPAGISQGLDDFLEEAKRAFGESLVSVVLFGSAAEGRLRPTSDLNLLLLLKKFDRTEADTIRPQLRTAHAAFRLNVMFLLEKEIAAASEAFAVKFADILTRRQVLFGPDPFGSLQLSDEALCRRTGQVLMNLTLRMRERYLLVSMREEQLGAVVAEMTGPLRAAASALLRLEGAPARTPKEALARIVTELAGQKAVEWLGLIDRMRMQEEIPHGAAADLLILLMEIAGRMHDRIEAISACRGAVRRG